MKKYLLLVALCLLSFCSFGQKYQKGLIDKTVGIVGNEAITLFDIESEIQMMKAQGYMSDKNARCEVLEQMLEQKLFLMQARIDSLSVNNDIVESQLSQRIDQVRTGLGGDAQVEEYFKKPVYKLRQEWRQQLEDMSLQQQEQQQIAANIPELTPYDVKQYLDTADKSNLPIIPIKYRMSQICVYPDREAAAMAVKEKLLALRERILNGDRFAMLARLYSEDPGSARKGGELGMASKSIFWPAFSDAAMALKPGIISQIVETPDGFHIIEVLEKKGDMFNARHILMKPKYTDEDQKNAFHLLDSLKTQIVDSSKISFEMAARFYSQDLATRTNGGQMADPNTGSVYFEIDQIKPQDFAAVQQLKEGEVSDPIASLDNEGRDGNLVYKIVRLDKILPSHIATFEHDYTELLEQVKQQKQMEAIRVFVKKKITTTHIIIDPLFKDCPFENEEWQEKVRN